MSFCKFTTIKDAEFVGMSNYIDALKDTTFTGSFRFAALFAIVTLVLINVLAFLIALALTQNIKGTNIFRTVFFMPNLIGGIVLGYVWQLIFDAIFARFGLALKLNETLGFWGLVILVCCSMAAWFITRVENVITKIIYLLCVFSMVIPFQMVMFTLSGTADSLHLNAPWGIIIVYLGFGAGLAVFMFCGFVKSIPIEVEEAAMIDGCTPLQTFFKVVLPMMKPTYISVGILEAMWIWNDFLLPYLVLDIKKYKIISIVVQYMKGSYGRVDRGAIMACLIMAIIPVVVFYLSAQKYIIKGVAAGAVKG